VIILSRQRVQAFSNKQIELVVSFADQAVIAMENARLITETREALEQQTATAEVLQVINASPGHLIPVWDAMLEKATKLCKAASGILWLYDAGRFQATAFYGVPPSLAEAMLNNPSPKAIPTDSLAAIAAGQSVVRDDDLTKNRGAERVVQLGGMRSGFLVALRKGGALLGAIRIFRKEARPFTEKQIALVQSFAAQAVIAMENARLITETREALAQQTATAEVLQVINSSPGNLSPVFDAMLEKALHLCGGAFGILNVFDGESFAGVAMRGLPPAFAAYRQGNPAGPGAGTAPARIVAGEDVVHNLDLKDEEPYRRGDPNRRAIVDLGGARSHLAVAMRKDNVLLGMLTIYRQEVRAFADKEIILLQNFAAQAVIAIENARLMIETREARDDAESALRDLKAAQANLIQAEKMASLGQLTAGIAHEIKNPLNFTLNFASLSVELLDELKVTAAPVVATADDDRRADIEETMSLLTNNLEKIAEHGKRADGIVRSMLEHSRGVTGERREVDLNGVVDEALNLAYHGARAQDQNFNIALERDFGPGIAAIELAPQEITRVCLNLFSNGFYAASKRARETGDATFTPTLNIRTRDLGDAVEIRIRDNGIGIPPEVRDKLFQPFFTTKPTGEGTGLGLSISYDIVTQQHGGSIEVESEVGAFTEFIVRLPRQQGATGRIP
jgi:signal transduction histidine kinase